MPIHMREFTLKQLHKESIERSKQDNEFTADDVASGKTFSKPKNLPDGTYKTKKKAP